MRDWIGDLRVGDQSRSKSALALIAALTLITAVNLASAELFPTVFADETMFVDPAANLALDGKFVSTAWRDEPDSRTWAGNAPLYSLALAGWIKLLGLSITSVRSLNLTLVFLATVLFWMAARRAGLLRSNTYALIAAIVPLLEYGIAFNYRAGRYDCLGMLLVSVVAYGASREWSPRIILLFVACLAIPASGLQVALYMGIVFLLAFTIFGRSALPAVSVGALGLAAGAALLLGAFAEQGVLDVFLATTRRLRAIVDGSTPKDPSFWLLVLATIIQATRSTNQAWWRQPCLVFLAAVSLLAPLLIYTAGRFPTYYTWMSIYPLCALLFTLIERSDAQASRIATGAVAGLIIASCLLGLPLQLASGVFYGRARNYEEVRRVVGPVGSEDVVVCDPSAYYAIRRTASKTYLTEYVLLGDWMNSEQRRRVNKMVIQPKDFTALSERLGGSWESGAKSSPATGELPLLGRNFGDKLIATYDLQVFHRVSATTD